MSLTIYEVCSMIITFIIKLRHQLFFDISSGWTLKSLILKPKLYLINYLESTQNCFLILFNVFFYLVWWTEYYYLLLVPILLRITPFNEPKPRHAQDWTSFPIFHPLKQKAEELAQRKCCVVWESTECKNTMLTIIWPYNVA